MSRTIVAILAAALLAPAAALAQQAAPAAAPAPDAKPADPPKPPPWYSVVNVNGYVDAYYQLRLDESQTVPVNARAFDAPTGFTLGNAVLSAAMAPAPAGFRLDLIFGNTNSVIDSVSAAASGSSTPTIANHVLQAYAAMKLGSAEVNFGRFTTSAGAEVVLAKDNWLYSRSLLFNLVPITHTGIRVTMPVTDTITVQGAIVNGWDAVTSSGYNGKTGSLQIAYAGPNATTVALTGYFGPNQILWSGAANRNDDWRTLIDFVAGTTLGSIGLNLNLDYGNEASHSWYGGALMGRYSFAGDVARITLRGEYVKDDGGVRFATGVDTKVWEITGGVSVPVGGNSELRLEGRYDKADQNVFGPNKDNQATLTLAALAWF